MKTKPLVSVVFATRNRKDDLMRALESCLAQDYPSLEVLVYDDASTDGTSKEVKEKYPEIRLFTEKEQKGYIVLRNRGFKDAKGEYVFSIDDDAYYTDRRTISQTVSDFDAHPEAVAIALPYIEPASNAIDESPHKINVHQSLRSYIGCAHALRKNTINDTGDYRDFFIHQGEERDLSIRLLDTGQSIIYGDSPVIVHLYSPNRDQHRLNRYGIRNTLLFDSLNIPHPYVCPRLLIDCVRLFFYKLNLSNSPKKIWYILCGLCACIKHLGKRKPVKRSTYQHFRSLARHSAERREGPIPPPVTR